jgi:hypothetical protein
MGLRVALGRCEGPGREIARSFDGLRFRRCCQVGDRAQHLAAVANHDAELLEVLIRQVRENAQLDPILDKQLRILAQAKVLQPIHKLLHTGTQIWENRAEALQEP